MEKKRILIIDDEDDIRTLYKKHLEALGGFEVDTAPDGQEGIRLAREIRPSVIILDILMPGLNGFEVLEQLKKGDETKEIPVIMLSCKGDDLFKVKATQLRDDLYLTKPIGAKELKKKIEDVLRIKEMAG